MRILIRADASHSIGTGHVMRSLVLAQRFREDSVHFATKSLQGNLDKQIQKAGYGLHSLKSNKTQELANLCKKLKVELLILDHYKLDYTFEKEIKKLLPYVTLMVLDDTYQMHHCDILLNHNIYAKKSHYKKLVPKNTLLQCGAKYTLLRDEFLLRNKVKKENSLLVAMGGSDPLNLTIDILETLLQKESHHIDVVTTTANKNLKSLQEYVKDKKHIRLHINTNEFATLALRAKLAIIAAGVMANELYSIQVPFIAVQTAKNQKYMCEFLKEKNYQVIKKFSTKKLQKALQEHTSD